MIKEIEDSIGPLLLKLENHRVYSLIKTQKELSLFMERHVFAVLDFMSLLNSLKKGLLPTETFWAPRADNNISRFLNEIVLGEESDVSYDGKFLSHFELYCQAMNEVSCDTKLIHEFTRNAQSKGLLPALEINPIPKSANNFIINTFKLIEENSIHKLVASFCFGREKIIPKMFVALLDKIGIEEKIAPSFYYYIKRHIEVDGENHGPMSEHLLSAVCGDDPLKWEEARLAAVVSLSQRLDFWDQVSLEIEENL